MINIFPKETQQIAEEGYTYAFPMLLGYRFASASFLMPRIPSYRGPDDVSALAKVMASYKMQPLSTYRGQAAPAPPSEPIGYPRPKEAFLPGYAHLLARKRSA